MVGFRNTLLGSYVLKVHLLFSKLLRDHKTSVSHLFFGKILIFGIKKGSYLLEFKKTRESEIVENYIFQYFWTSEKEAACSAGIFTQVVAAKERTRRVRLLEF